MKKLTIATTGGDGLIGSRLIALLRQDFDFIPIYQAQMNITDQEQTNLFIKKIEFDIFLHLAAYTNVDGAEKEKTLAWDINVNGTKNVFAAAAAKKKPFIYISTDFVFDGQSPPFFEDSPPQPISCYGLTKHEGENIVRNQAMIVRFSYPYRAHFEMKTDIVRSIISALRQKKLIHGIVDQIITFTFIDDIAYALKHLFNHYSPEIFHVVGADSLSAYEAMLTICDVFNFDKSLVGQTTYEEFYAGRAQRPKKGIIKSKKNDFYQMKTFAEGLAEVKRQMLFTPTR